MRVITLNVNGIRSAAKKGLFEWLARRNADVVCLQEVKAQQADLTDQMLAPKGFHGFFNCAEKKGYAGVALYSRREPDRLRVGFGSKEHDDEGREYILCGDWNIAHKEIDLKNWKSNRKNSGFLPEERTWLTQVFDELGWVDVFRTLNDKPDQYTWWSNRGRAYEKNVGWRIDYQIATPGIAKKAEKERIYKDKRFSDHAPLIIDYGYKL